MNGQDLLIYPSKWGQALIQTRDIDPIYDMLVSAQLPAETLAGWLVAYWCFYHAGVASYMARLSGATFWEHMWLAAKNITANPSRDGGRWPRSAERRHFRGDKAVLAIEKMAVDYPQPILMVDYLIKAPGDAPAVIHRAQELPQFGPWIAFKIADMLERIWGRKTHFPDDVALYESPKKGLHEISVLWNTTQEDTLNLLFQAIRPPLKPPGLNSRPCGMQELETILCKWHSAKGGHYYIGKDLKEIRHALEGWGHLADELRVGHLPPLISETSVPTHPDLVTVDS